MSRACSESLTEDQYQLNQDECERQEEGCQANRLVRRRDEERQDQDQESRDEEPAAPDHPADENAHRFTMAEWTASRC